jgi:hypothetical protein
MNAPDPDSALQLLSAATPSTVPDALQAAVALESAASTSRSRLCLRQAACKIKQHEHPIALQGRGSIDDGLHADQCTKRKCFKQVRHCLLCIVNLAAWLLPQ